MADQYKVTYAKAVHGAEERAQVLEVLDNEATIMGKKTEEFEGRVATLFGKKHGIMVNSGSSANMVAVELMNLPKGAEVITPAMTFSTTVAPLVQKELMPVFVDAAPGGSYLLDIDQVEEMITEKTKALFVPSLLGNVPDYRKLREIADAHDLFLIEDSCDTITPTIGGEPTGKYTDMTITSFYGSHVMTAGGNGGMIMVNDDTWERDARVIRGWGRSSAADENESLEDRFNYELAGQPHDSKFIFERVAYNFLPNEMSAAFGLAQLDKLETFVATRRKNFADFKEFFSQWSDWFILPEQLADVETAWLGFPMTLTEAAPFKRMDMALYLEKHGIQTRPVFTGNILMHPGFKDIPCRTREGGYPVSEAIMRRAMFIGCHHGMNDDDRAYIKQVFEDFVKTVQA